LNRLPSSLVEQLRDAAIEGRAKRLESLADQAHQHSEDLSAEIRALAHDFQYDVRMDDFIKNADGTPKLDSDGNPLEKTNVVHNARLFLGFTDKFYKGVEFIASVEYLQDLTDGNTFRFVFDGGIKAAIAPHFALATAVNVHYENNPLPNVVNTDVIGAVSLVYNMF